MSIVIVSYTLLLVSALVILKLRGVDIAPLLEIVDKFKLGMVFLTVIGFHFGTYLLSSSIFNKPPKK